MRAVLSLIAVLAAGALGVVGQEVLDNIPSACNAQCAFTQSLEGDCSDAAAALGKRELVKNDLVSCLNKICAQSTFDQMNGCIDCLENQKVLDKPTAEQFLSTIRDTCGQLGTSVSPGAGAGQPGSAGTDASTGANAAPTGTAGTAPGASVSSAVNSAMSHAASHSSSAVAAASSIASAATSSSAAGAAAVVHPAALMQMGVAAAGVVAGAMLL